MPGDLTFNPPNDRELLAALRRDPRAETLRPLLERYGSLIYSSALRRTGSAVHASEVTQAVFLVLVRRARKLPRRLVIAEWLFRTTRLAARKVPIPGTSRWRWFKRRSGAPPPPDAPLPTRLLAHLDRAVDGLRTVHRKAVILRFLLVEDWAIIARSMRSSEVKAQRRSQSALKKLTRRLRRKASTDPETLAAVCASQGCAHSLPAEVIVGILASVDATRSKRPRLELARRMLRSMAWARWRTRAIVAPPALAMFLVALCAAIWQLDASTGHSRVRSALVYMFTWAYAVRRGEPARPWPAPGTRPVQDAARVEAAKDLYQTTNIWLAELSFSPAQWRALEPRNIGAMPHFVRADGMWTLRNPQARRSGVLGVLGYEFDWSQGALNFGGRHFTNVAIRAKGNLGSLQGPKRSFKVDLNKHVKGQKLAGLDELTFNNIAWDNTYVGEALGYEFFRAAEVPTPRTAYAWISVNVTNKWQQKPLGLYVMLESVDKSFTHDRFGSKQTPLFKPVTYDLFEYISEDWTAYAPIYDLKTEATPAQQQRLIDFSRLVSKGSDEEFAAAVGNYVDLDEFARFLAGQVLIANYDGILSDGQNFYLYLDPRSNKFGFIPWDLDAAWGVFWLASKREFEEASIRHPWAGENRFLERVMGVDQFRNLYMSHLDDFTRRLFVPKLLHARIDIIAAGLRDAVAAESSYRLQKFEEGVRHGTPKGGRAARDPKHRGHQLKDFIEARARSVRRQLDGQSQGVVIKIPTPE